MFMYSYFYVCSVLYILFHCVVLCIVCVQMCTVLPSPGVNLIAAHKIYHTEGRIEVTGRRGIRGKLLLDDPKEKRGY